MTYEHSILTEEIQIVGQQWVRPANWWYSPEGRPFAGAVTVESNIGVLMLVNIVHVLSGPDAGKIRYQPVRPEDVPVTEARP